MITTNSAAIQKVEGQVEDLRKSDVGDLRKTKVDREDNKAADDAQDKRIDDLKNEIESMHADIRTLISMQQGRR